MLDKEIAEILKYISKEKFRFNFDVNLDGEIILGICQISAFEKENEKNFEQEFEIKDDQNESQGSILLNIEKNVKNEIFLGILTYHLQVKEEKNVKKNRHFFLILSFFK